MAAAALSITPERQQVLDFTIPYINQGLTVLTLRHRNQPVSVYQAFLPLRIEVWISVIVALVVVAIVTTCINRLSPFDYYGRAVDQLRTLKNSSKDSCQDIKYWQTEKDNEIEAFSFSNNLWYTLESFLSQGAERTSRSIAARLITAMWWLASVIIIATYTANLTAFLTVNSLQTSKTYHYELKKIFRSITLHNSTMASFSVK